MKEFWRELLPPNSKDFAPSLAAVTGNAASSLIFVPKEVLKQRCQIGQLKEGQKALGLLRQIVEREGLGAMYNGYFATLLRNAPGSVLKVLHFVLLHIHQHNYDHITINVCVYSLSLSLSLSLSHTHTHIT
jgi:solute carrier family 25 S-adenosylmethionine transporter 26